MKNYFFALPLLVSLMASCGKKVSISYNASYCKDHVVKIDDTLTLKTDGEKQFLKKTLESGEHTLTIDGGKPVSFEIEDDGILNIAHQEFVIFPIEFSFGSEYNMGLKGTFGLPNVLVIDSFVVGNKELMENAASKVTRAKIIELGKSRQETELIENELLKTDSNQLVINKSWDIGVADEIPKSVQETFTSKTKSATVYRKKVMDAKLFVLYASISGSYTVQQLSDFQQ